MKKLFLTIAIVFALLTSCIAQNGGGLFQGVKILKVKKPKLFITEKGDFLVFHHTEKKVTNLHL